MVNKILLGFLAIITVVVTHYPEFIKVFDMLNLSLAIPSLPDQRAKEKLVPPTNDVLTVPPIVADPSETLPSSGASAKGCYLVTGHKGSTRVTSETGVFSSSCREAGLAVLLNPRLPSSGVYR